MHPAQNSVTSSLAEIPDHYKISSVLHLAASRQTGNSANKMWLQCLDICNLHLKCLLAASRQASTKTFCINVESDGQAGTNPAARMGQQVRNIVNTICPMTGPESPASRLEEECAKTA